jgi:hypothetical protein
MLNVRRTVFMGLRLRGLCANEIVLVGPTDGGTNRSFLVRIAVLFYEY